MAPPERPAPDPYGATRRGLHAVAEQVVAAARWRATGRIGLRPTPGGFGTPPFTVAGRVREVRVEGVDLVVDDGGDVRRAPLRSVAEAAAFVGVEPGAPDVYPAATPVAPDAPLGLDPAAAEGVHGWFATTARALDTLRRRIGGSGPPEAQLWPEHFDLAVAIGEVNYGGSPGDDHHDVPYAYVGPWDTARLTGDPFWNEPFGASRPRPEVPSVDLLVAFYEEGHTRTRPPA